MEGLEKHSLHTFCAYVSFIIIDRFVYTSSRSVWNVNALKPNMDQAVLLNIQKYQALLTNWCKKK